MVKSAIQDLQGGLNKLYDARNAKSMELDTDTDSGGKASMADIFDKFLPKKNQHSITVQSISQFTPSQSMSSSNEFSSVIRMYQTMI